MKTQALVSLSLLCALPLIVGCGKKGVDAEIQAFKDAGRAVSEFTDADAGLMQAKRCRQGTIDQMAVLLCEYSSRDAASAGVRNAAMWAGECPTWLSLQRDKVVFAVADRSEVDQNGKAVAALSKVFRRLAKK